MLPRRLRRNAKHRSISGFPRIKMRKLRITETVTDIAKRVPVRNTKRITTTRTVTKATRVTRLFTSLRKAIRAITTRRSTSTNMTRKRANRTRSTKKLDITVRSITVRRARRMRSLAKRGSTRRDTVRKENTASSRRMNMRRNMIFMTSITKTEEAKSMVVGTKSMRAKRVAMKRKAICMRDITRDIAGWKRNMTEATIIMKRKVTNRPRDTRAITIIMRDMVTKVVTHQGINFRNQIINDRRNETYFYIIVERISLISILRKTLWSNQGCTFGIILSGVYQMRQICQKL